MVIGDIIKFGEYAKEKILFEVVAIEDDKAFLVSKNIIDTRQFDGEVKETKFHKTKYIGNTDYETSTIRKWLNNDFYNTAFTDEEKEKIVTHTQTKDKVFLLSVDEYEKYLAERETRFKKGTECAKAYGLKYLTAPTFAAFVPYDPFDTPEDSEEYLKIYNEKYKHAGNGCYWLRTAHSSTDIYYVYIDGSIKTIFSFANYIGIVPAIIIKI